MHNPLCRFKDIFGKPGKGVHSIRIFNIAVVDVVFTILAAYLIHRYWLTDYNFYYILIGLFVLGIVLHKLFCVRTTIDKLIFG